MKAVILGSHLPKGPSQGIPLCSTPWSLSSRRIHASILKKPLTAGYVDISAKSCARSTSPPLATASEDQKKKMPQTSTGMATAACMHVTENRKKMPHISIGIILFREDKTTFKSRKYGKFLHCVKRLNLRTRRYTYTVLRGKWLTTCRYYHNTEIRAQNSLMDFEVL